MRNRLLPAIAFASLPAACLLAWMLRNWVVMGSLMGLRHPSRMSWGVSIEAALATLVAGWIVIGVAIGIAWIAKRFSSRSSSPTPSSS